MNCKKCNNPLLERAKFCNKCGTPVPLNPEEEAKAKKAVEELKKSVKNAGTSVYAIGWITILLNTVIYVWSIFDADFSESGLPVPDLGGIYIIAIAAVIFIVLGTRIRKLQDKKIKIYLQVLLGLSLVLLVWILSSGGRVGLLFILVIIYLLTSLRSISKLMKMDEFSSKLINPEYKLNKKGWVIFAIVAVFFYFVAIGFDSAISETLSSGNSAQAFQEENNLSKEELIQQIVEETKIGLTLPSELDSITILTDIVAERSAIRYEYTIHDLDDPNSMSISALREVIISGLCKNDSLVDVLNQGIDIKYLYSVRETRETYPVFFTKGDCPST